MDCSCDFSAGWEGVGAGDRSRSSALPALLRHVIRCSQRDAGWVSYVPDITVVIATFALQDAMSRDL